MKTISGIVSDETGNPIPGVNIIVEGSNRGTQTDYDGRYTIEAQEEDVLVFSYIEYKTKKQKVKQNHKINITLAPDTGTLDEIVVTGYGIQLRGVSSSNITESESYKQIDENIFKAVSTAPLSTFSIDVDKAAYSNIRRMINNGQEVPKDAVKIEEMINYFNYDYPQPAGDDPFSIHTEIAQTPWNQDTKIVKIGLQGKTVPLEDVPASNLVFLIDVSGSMNGTNRLPLLKSAFKLLTNQLRPQDKVAIVVYAGAAGLVLPSTSGSEKNKIRLPWKVLPQEDLPEGGAGIELAYKVASENYIEGGNNRVIIATDGDFNVGASSDSSMEKLIEQKRETGIFLTALGFGMGNYKGSKLETLAEKGNGNHAYIDTMQEAQRVLGTEFGGTIYTIAKDVKKQVEFNPAKVQGYRLIGYESRILKDEDFNDDKKDAGELGSGHTVTALYEIIPTGVKSKFLKDVDELKYSERKLKNLGDELFTVKFRYKNPDGNKSMLIEKAVIDSGSELAFAGEDLGFATSVALFGMILRNSEYANGARLNQVVELAENSRGRDEDGYRVEFIRLVKLVQEEN